MTGGVRVPRFRGLQRLGKVFPHARGYTPFDMPIGNNQLKDKTFTNSRSAGLGVSVPKVPLWRYLKQFFAAAPMGGISVTGTSSRTKGPTSGEYTSGNRAMRFTGSYSYFDVAGSSFSVSVRRARRGAGRVVGSGAGGCGGAVGGVVGVGGVPEEVAPRVELAAEQVRGVKRSAYPVVVLGTAGIRVVNAAIGAALAPAAPVVGLPVLGR